MKWIALAVLVALPKHDYGAPRAGDVGRTIFMERCASCHAERGDKPLSKGLPLSERRLSMEQIQDTVNSRLSGSSDADKRAVALYIAGIVKK